jgi:hypothetical protein
MKPSPDIRISVKNSANGVVKIRLYDARHFGGPDGVYRMKIGREWVRADEKYVFFSPAGALEFAARSVGFAPEIGPRPGVEKGDRVRVRVPDGDGGLVCEKCFVTTPPFIGHDGRWRVFVLTFQRGVVDVLCDEVHMAS